MTALKCVVVCKLSCVQRCNTNQRWTVAGDGNVSCNSCVQLNVTVFHWLYYRRRLLRRYCHVSAHEQTRLQHQVRNQFTPII